MPNLTRCPGCWIILLAPTIAVAAPNIYVEPTSIDFGRKVINEPTPVYQTVTVQNQSGDPLVFTGPLTLGGPHASQFQIAEASTATLGANGIHKFRIAFSPTTPDVKLSSLSIPTNDPDSPVTSVFLVGNAVPPRPVPYSGPYDGYGPGTSTIGTGQNYSTLSEACQAISSTPLTGGDWTFIITQNLNELNNSFLTQKNTSGRRITFRPAVSTSSTITFQAPVQNPLSFPGNWVIGARYQSGSPGSWIYEPTHGITIEGSNSPTTDTRNLAFRNLDNFSGVTSLIHVAGNCDNTSIRNAYFDHYSGFTSSNEGVTGSIEFLSEPVPAGFTFNYIGSADNALVENCHIIEKGIFSSAAIAINRRLRQINNFPDLTPSANVSLRGNTIRSATGISAKAVSNINITNNTIDLYDIDFLPLKGISFVMETTGSTASAFVDGNTIRFDVSDPTEQSMYGISTETYRTTSTCRVTNNMITGLTGPIALSPAVRRHAVHSISDNVSTITIAHNSINMHHIEGTTASATATAAITFGTQFFASLGDASIKNNIIRVHTPGASAIYRPNIPSLFESNHNIFSTTTSAIIARLSDSGADDYENLVEWQTDTGHDLDSRVGEPFVALGPGLGTWAGPAHSLAPDLHFTAFPGDDYRVPTIPEVTVDLDRQPRSSPWAIAGADEVPFNAGITHWTLY